MLAEAMSDYKDMFRTEGSRNWCKAWTAVHILRDGLKDWVRDEMQNYLKSMFPAGSGCTTCTTPNALPCPTRNICKLNNRRLCNYHDTPARRYSSCAVHDNIRAAIIREHRFPNNPSWNNTLAENWTTSSWEIAKCFMPPNGYLDKPTADDTDFNGIVSPVINCKRFQNLMDNDLSDPVTGNICTKVRNKVNEIRHFENMEPNISDVDLTNYIDLFSDLLNDAKSLQMNPKAIEARGKLDKLKKDTLVITTEDVERILKDAQSVMKTIQDSFQTAMDSTKINALKEIQDSLDAAMKRCIDAGTEQEKRVEDKGFQVEQRLDDKGSQVEERLDDKGSQVEQRLDDKRSQVEQRLDDKGSHVEQRLDDKSSQVEERLGDKSLQVEERLDDKGSQVEQRLDDKGSQVEQRLDDQGSHVEQRLDDKSSQVEERLDDKGSQVEERLDDKGSQVEQRLDDKRSQVEERLDDKGSHVEKRLDDKSSQVEERLDDKSLQVEERLVDKGSQVEQRLDDKGSQVEQRLDNKGSQVEDRLDDKGSQVEQRLDDKGSQVEQRLDDQGSHVEQRLDDKSSQVEERLDDKGSQVEERLDDKGSQVEQRLDDKRSQLEERLDDKGSHVEKRLDDKSSQVEERLDDKSLQVEERLVDKGSQVEQRLDDKGSQVEQRLDNKGSQVEDRLDDKGSQVEQRLDDKGSQVEQRLDDKGSQVEERLDDKGSQVEERLDDKGSHVEKRLDDKSSQVEERLDDKSLQVEERLVDKGSQVEQRLDDKGFQVEQRLDNKGSQVEDRLDDKGSQVEQRLDDKGSQVEQRLDDKGSQVEERLDNKGSQVEERLDDKGSQVEERLDDKGSQVEQRLDDKGSQVEQRLDDKVSQVEQQVEDALRKQLKNQAESEFHSKKAIKTQEKPTADENYEEKKNELRHALAQHYWTKHNSMPLSPLMPEVDDELIKFYTAPKMNKMDTKSSTKSAQTQDIVDTYKALFYDDNNPHRNIYIQGKAGIGKTTFCTKLGLVWSEKYLPECSKNDSSINESTIKSIKIEEVFSDKNIMNEFDFVFSLALRNVEGECEIQKMIRTQIISELTGDENKYAELVTEILDKERCLIILDGLDEWSHQRNYKKSPQLLVPHRKLWRKTTVLTSTRPWKMNELCLRDSEISVLIQITGLTDTRTFSENVLNCLNDKYKKTTLDVKDFLRYMRDKKLEHFFDIPVVAMQLLWLWHGGHELGDSKRNIYMNMLGMLFGRAQEKPQSACDDTTDIPKAGLPPCFESKEFCEQHKMLLDCLGSLAFHTLHSSEREESLVFSESIVKSYVKSTAARETALTTGILSQHKSSSRNKRTSHFSFLHKTFQEFLAAYYIVTHVDESENIVQTLFQVYGQTVDIMDISELFIFVCGMDTDMSCKISDSVMKSFSVKLTNHIEELHVSGGVYTVAGMTKSLQEMILAGYKESISNGHQDPQLALHHVDYRDYISGDDEIYRDRLVDMNIDKIVTLSAGTTYGIQNCTVDVVKIQQILTQSSSTLSHVSFRDIEGLTDASLDLFTNITLKSLNLHYIYTHFDIKLDTSSLLYCYLGDINKEVEHSVLSALTTASKLHTLEVWCCKNMSVLCQVLPTLPMLHTLDVKEKMISASLCQVMSTLSQLQRLIVGKGCEDPSLLCQAPSTLSNLQYIGLDWTDLGDDDILLPNSIQEIELRWVKLTCRSVRQLVDRLTQIPHKVTCTLKMCSVRPEKEWRLVTVAERDAIVKHIQQCHMFEIHENDINRRGHINLQFNKIQT